MFRFTVYQVCIFTIPDLVNEEVKLVDNNEGHNDVVCYDVEDSPIEKVFLHECLFHIIELHLVYN